MVEKQYSQEIKCNEYKLRFSTIFLGAQIFTFFLNFTGWDTLTFALPFWGAYIFLRIYEKGGIEALRISKKAFRDYWLLLVWGTMNIIEAVVYWSRDRVPLLMSCYCLGVVFFFTFIDAKLSEYEFNWLIKMYSYMGILTTILILAERVNVETYTNRFTLSVFGVNKDPNFMAAYLLFPTVYALYKYEVSKNKKSLFVALIIAIGILLTGSRAAFLGLVISIAVLIFYKIKRVDVFIRAIALVAVAGVIIYFVLPESMSSRFILSESLSDDSNKLRWRLWKMGINIWQDHALLGAGQNAVITLGKQYGSPIPIMAHNTFIEILAEFGVFGFICFIFPIIVIIKKAFKHKQVCILSIMAGVLVVTLIVSAQHAQYYWFALALCGSMILHKESFR